MPAPLFPGPVLLVLVTGYLLLLLGIGTLGERRFEYLRARGLDRYVYVFAAGVYCTSWTFYGCIGNAAQTGPSFLGLFVGPSIFALFWWFVLRKLVRVCRRYNVTSVPDFLSVRYGSHRWIGPAATLLLVVGSVPYISLQLQAVAISFNLLGGPQSGWAAVDPMLIVSVFMGAFALIFGGRYLDFTKRQGGLLTAVAFESLVKVLIFLAAGLFVCYGVFDGPGAIFRRAFADPELRRLLSLSGTPGSGYSRWIAYMAIATIDVILLPRQFHILVVQNGDEKHVRTAMWLFPLYLLVINLFVIPIALGGRLLGLPPQAGDKYILAIPMMGGHAAMSLLIFLGGFSAATAMVLVSSVALGKMVANNLLIPGILAVRRGQHGYRHLLAAARASILVVIGLGYLYARTMSRNAALMEIGIISFVAVAQFGPAVLGGLYWKGAGARGAMLGLAAGFFTWAYTLVLPAMVKAGLVGRGILDAGPGGIAALRPTDLLGAGFGDPVWNAVFWSLALNLLGLLAGSWIWAPEAEARPAREIVGGERESPAIARAEAVERPAAGAHYMSLDEIRDVVTRYTGQEKHEEIEEVVREIRDVRAKGDARDAVVRQMDLPSRLERVLTGSIGAIAARSVLKEMLPLSLAEARTLIESYREMEKDLATTREEVSQKEAEIRARERFLASVVRSIDDGIVSFDLDGRITTVNEGAVRLFACPEPELIGRDFSDLIRDSQYREKRRIIARSTYRAGVWRGEVDIVRKDGAEVPVLLSTAKIISPRGRPLGFVGSFKDLRELKTMQAKILQSEKLATLGQMAAGVAHEIRNPLGSIKMSMRLLGREAGGEQASEEVEQIREAVGSMEVIVNELLDYTRDIILTVDEYDVGKIVRAAVGAVEADGGGQGVAVRVEETDAPVTATVDGVRVKQIVTNVVRNAVEAAALRGRTVTVGLRRDAGQVRIEVRDSGPGMGPEELGKVFQPFYTTKAQGVGLGMPIVKRLVELHGGDVEVTSTAGQGTVVSVSLPRFPFGLAEGRG